jgi:DNA-binding PucR family transcriptional regulator
LLFQIEVMARDGIPLRPFTRMCHLAHGAFLDAWDAELTKAQLPRDVQLAAIRGAHQLTFQWFDSLVERLTGVYERELARLARTPETIRRAAVVSALTGGAVDLDALSRATGYEFRRQHVGLVLWRTDPGAPDDLEQRADAQPTLTAAARQIAASAGAGPPLVVPAGSSTAWVWIGVRDSDQLATVQRAAAAFRAPQLAAALGEPAAGLGGFRHTHEDALAAAHVAMLQGKRAEPVTSFRSVELVALLAGDLRRARLFVLRRLGALAQDDDEHGRMRAALRLHLQGNGNRVAAARELGVHPNTVSNRVRAAEALLAPGQAAGRAELHVALLLAETLGSPVLSERP